jgi:hypothetical protein
VVAPTLEVLDAMKDEQISVAPVRNSGGSLEELPVDFSEYYKIRIRENG